MEPIQILALLMLAFVLGAYATKSAQRRAWLAEQERRKAAEAAPAQD